jgi:hypothetical protein
MAQTQYWQPQVPRASDAIEAQLNYLAYTGQRPVSYAQSLPASERREGPRPEPHRVPIRNAPRQRNAHARSLRLSTPRASEPRAKLRPGRGDPARPGSPPPQHRAAHAGLLGRGPGMTAGNRPGIAWVAGVGASAGLGAAVALRARRATRGHHRSQRRARDGGRRGDPRYRRERHRPTGVTRRRIRYAGSVRRPPR